MDWERNVRLSISQRRQVFIDRHDNVLLLVGTDNEGNTEWVPDGRLGGQLVLLRLSNGTTRNVEWRRNRLLIVKGDDRPRYISLPVSEFRQAISNSRTYPDQIERLIDSLSPPDETSAGAPSFVGAETRPD